MIVGLLILGVCFYFVVLLLVRESTYDVARVRGCYVGWWNLMDVFVSYALLFALAWPLGLYMAKVFRFERTFLDPIFGPLERGVYRLLRIDVTRGMTWRGYGLALLWSNFPLAVLGYLIFSLQGALPLNPDSIGNMNWDLALHTTASFITNTNQQHYSGQAQLSYLAQMAGIVTIQMVTPAVGIAAFVAVLRGITGGLRPQNANPADALPRARPSRCRFGDEQWHASRQRSWQHGRFGQRPHQAARGR